MKKWSFISKQKPEQAIENLKSAIQLINGISFSIERKNKDSIGFSFRKRILDGEKILHINSVIVKGTLSKTDKENESSAQFIFKEHPLVTFTNYIIYGLPILGIIAGIIKNPMLFIPAGIILVLIILIWVWMNSKFKKYVEEYKSLISDSL